MIADRLTFAAADGSLELAAQGLPLLRIAGLRPEIAYRRNGEAATWRADVRGAIDDLESQQPRDGLRLRLRAQPTDAGLILGTTLTNEGTQAVHLSHVAPLSTVGVGACEVGSGADRWTIYRHGYQSWSGTRRFRTDEVDRDPWSALLRVGLVDVGRPAPARAGHFRSDLFTLVKNARSGEALALGFLDASQAFGEIEVAVEGQRCTRLAATLDCDGIRLAPGQELHLAPLWIAVGFDEHALLAAYADAVAAAMRARVPRRNPVGWCSWYYYFTRIDENKIVENVRALERLRPQFPCDYVQVDDGYQAAIGDWLTPNRKFSRGMGWIAEQIRERGFDAGIWTAPFLARAGSRLLAEHRDWFVRNESGRPRFALWNPLWGIWGSCYALDTTHPEVLDWLRSTFRVIAREWGYRILKLDFLYAAALPGLRHDTRSTRAMALRRGLEAIREGAGDDAFLLGCGCPIGPAIGVVDAMRIGPDVAPFWSNALSRTAQRDLHGLATKNAVRNVLTRAVFHRRWWLNDPDCLMVRETKTRLTEEEIRSLATAIGITDGMIVLSDRVESLSAARLEVLQRAFCFSGGKTDIVDLMASDMPELVTARIDDRLIVALFNFSDRAERRRLDLREVGLDGGGLKSLVEIWTQSSIPVVDGIAEVGEIPAHGCRVLELPGERA